MIGSEVGIYRIIEKIGEGGMGVVYKGVDTNLDRQVAIKVLRPELTYDSELVERFRDEAKAQANLNHVNIATLYSFAYAEGYCLIVMEFIEGSTFEMMLSTRGRLPWKGAVSLMKQALHGLEFAHARGVVHRDIKPANLMLTNTGIVKIMDFGIVKALGGNMQTQTGSVIGTPRYMSPEQIRGQQVDARADIYSLGVTFYELLTGDAPFKGDSDYDLMSAHIHTPPPSFTSFHKDIPRNIEACVIKALAKDPANRFQTAEEFGAALAAATEAPQSDRDERERRKKKQKSEKSIWLDFGGGTSQQEKENQSLQGYSDGGKIAGSRTKRAFSELWRMLRVPIVPGKVFGELRERARWWPPVLLLAIADLAWVYGFRFTDTIRLGSPFLFELHGFWMYLLPLLNLLFYFVISAIVVGVVRVFTRSSDLSFKLAFMVAMYSRIPLVIETALSTVTNGKLLPFMPVEWVSFVDFSVRYLPWLSMNPNRNLVNRILFEPNLFTVWSLILFSVGLSRASKLKRSTAAFVVFGVFILDALINAVCAWKHWM